MKCSDCNPNWWDYEENLAEIASLRQQLAEMQWGTCVMCGGVLSKNPHPNAGNLKHLLEVGAEYECIPCLYGRSYRRQTKLLVAQERIDELETIVKLIEKGNDE